MGLGQVYLGLLEPRAYEMQARNSFPRLNTAILGIFYVSRDKVYHLDVSRRLRKIKRFSPKRKVIADQPAKESIGTYRNERPGQKGIRLRPFVSANPVS